MFKHFKPSSGGVRTLLEFSILTLIIMKLSELTSRTASLNKRLGKVFGEQQRLIDDLKVKVAALTEALKNANTDIDVPADLAARISEIETLIGAVDDQIPDVDDSGGGTPPEPEPQPEPAEPTGQTTVPPPPEKLPPTEEA